MQTKKFYEQRVTVEGIGDFPVDMLRYDSCCPESEDQSPLITDAHGERRQVRLRRFAVEPKRMPAVRRWQSFGWRVVRVEFGDETVASAAAMEHAR